MAFRNFSDLARGKTLQPSSEINRLNYVKERRKLYNGDFTGLGIKQGELKINWFRRVAQFFPEFMLAARPTLTLQNTRMQEALNPVLPRLFTVLQYVNEDMLRFGRGNLTMLPHNPLQPARFEDDNHYEVVNDLGEHLGDIFIRIRQPQGVEGKDITAQVLGSDKALADVYHYPVAGNPIWEIYKYTPGALGNLVSRQELPPRQGLQNVLLSNNLGSVSIFDDMMTPVGQMSKTVQRLDTVLERNSHPHLYGPDGMLKLDSSNRAVVDSDNGMFLPLQQDDVTPGYLQWDSNIDAMKWDFENHERTALIMASLSTLLFDPTQQTNSLSGVALRRTLIPTYAKLLSMKETNEAAIRDWIAIWNQNRLQSNMEVFAYTEDEIEIEWPFVNIFEDLTEGAADDAADD